MLQGRKAEEGSATTCLIQKEKKKEKKKKKVDHCIQSKYCQQCEFSFSTQRFERNNKKKCFLPFESVRRSAEQAGGLGFALSLNF